LTIVSERLLRRLRNRSSAVSAEPWKRGGLARRIFTLHCGFSAESRVEAVIRALDTPFRETAFDLEITGAGVFPPTGAPRVIWLGLTSGADALRRLHAELAARLPSLGFEPERRAYSAHLTIARIKEVPRSGSYREIRDAIHNQPAHAGRCRIEAVTLFRSRLSPKGASYEAILRVPLK
jgi:2'-5' RNA ligase